MIKLTPDTDTAPVKLKERKIVSIRPLTCRADHEGLTPIYQKGFSLSALLGLTHKDRPLGFKTPEGNLISNEMNPTQKSLKKLKKASLQEGSHLKPEI